jgi:hypothetical protein
MKNTGILRQPNGCSLASALTEYIRFKKYPDQVEPVDEDHIYFNADPGENRL